MPLTGLGESLLDTKTIDSVVTRKSAGTYVLGHIETKKEKGEEKKTFVVEYVGRSDDDINGRLKKWVGSKYKRFKFGYYGSPKAAFEKECSIYHDFGEKELLDNDRHPDRPEKANWKCPRCDIFNGET
jgi:hypothetical protein